jgi:hypothetical protein
MYDKREYEQLVLKYGGYSSWAVWDYKKESELTVIEQQVESLNSRNVFLALNISAPLVGDPWCNFHGGKHDRKIKYACNDTELRGSYITDIFKGLDELHSSNVESKLTPEIIDKNVGDFSQEMKDIKLASDSKFIIFGTPDSFIAKCFNQYFRQDFKNEVFYHYHYSYYKLTDKQWVEGLWKKLGITSDFENTVAKYRK